MEEVTLPKVSVKLLPGFGVQLNLHTKVGLHGSGRVCPWAPTLLLPPHPPGTPTLLSPQAHPLNPYFLPPYFLPKGLLLSYSLPGSHSPGISIPRTSRDFRLSP